MIRLSERPDLYISPEALRPLVLWTTVRKMGCGAMKVACEDGFEIVTKDAKELVSHVQMHLKNTHNKHASEHEIMAMSKHP